MLHTNSISKNLGIVDKQLIINYILTYILFIPALFSNIYKINEKDLWLQKFPKHISIHNIHYLLIKCNVFEIFLYFF